MKRSSSIRLVLLGGLSAGALSGCNPDARRPPVTEAAVYTNNHYLPGVGYYHAPFRAWYGLPYNDFEPASQRYFYGGQWGSTPHQSFTNISSPTAAAVQAAEAQRTDVKRGGFGGTSHRRSSFVHS